MTITLYQESRSTGEHQLTYFVTLQSAHHHYCRKVSKVAWLAILDHLWNNPLFTHTKFDVKYYNSVKYYNGGQDAVWTDEFKEC